MDLVEFRKAYHDHTTKTSEVVQSLAFAGIAVVWVFRIGETGIHIPQSLVLPLALFVATLACHLMHYLAGAAAWGIFCRSKEKQMNAKESKGTAILAPRWINWPALTFFVLKVCLVVAGYATLLAYAASAVSC